jgi:adenylate cyclase class 2
MQTEIEAKFLAVDHRMMRSKLRKQGAECRHSMRLMKRTNYDFPDGRLQKVGGWVRLRDEGDKITLSHKWLTERSLHGMKEASVVVDSLGLANGFLLSIGLTPKSYQETKRESWQLGNAQVELDEWPWIRPFLEIEGPTEESVRETVGRLDLSWEAAIHGSVEVAYQAEYDVTEAEIDHWPEIVFTPVPGWLAAKRKQAVAS